jgi:hypothetical protein
MVDPAAEPVLEDALDIALDYLEFTGKAYPYSDTRFAGCAGDLRGLESGLPAQDSSCELRHRYYREWARVGQAPS